MLSKTSTVIRVAELPLEWPLVWIPTTHRWLLDNHQTGAPL
jgi:hypothetical protein